MMLEELQRLNYAKTTIQYYLNAVERFAKHFKRSPDQLNQDHLRAYQAYLLRERKLKPRTVKLHLSALRFFVVKTLKRSYLLDDIPYPRSRAACRPSQSGVAHVRHDAEPGISAFKFGISGPFGFGIRNNATIARLRLGHRRWPPSPLPTASSTGPLSGVERELTHVMPVR
jgi:integrase-like protein